jgi:hypothetical protein
MKRLLSPAGPPKFAHVVIRAHVLLRPEDACMFALEIVTGLRTVNAAANYRVVPKPEPLESHEYPSPHYCIIALPIVVVGTAALLFIGTAEQGKSETRVFPSILALMLAAVASCLLNCCRGSRRSITAAQEKKGIRVAADVTKRAFLCMDECRSVVENLGSACSQLGELIGRATEEFEAKAFSSFWDTVEQAGNITWKAKELLDELQKIKQSYSDALLGYQNTFPEIPYEAENLPELSGLLSQLRSAMRKAECSFEFAMIYEQRRTQNVLKDGIRGMVELQRQVDSSLDLLRGQMASPRVGFAVTIPRL